jgi:ferredoxin
VSEQHDRRPGVGTPRDLELRVNPIACDAHGLCMELLPEIISADPWGFPVIRPGPVPLRLLSLARRAVADCPTLALLLAERPRAEPGVGRADVRRDR